MENKYFIFIDESGNPDFFGKRKRPLWEGEHFNPVLIMGMIVVRERRTLREKVEEFQRKMKTDVLYNSIHSLQKEGWFLHAKDDHFEIRIKFIEFLRSLGDMVDCYVAIARKKPELFVKKHNGNAKEFYFDVLSKMLELLKFENGATYQISLARRQSDSQKSFQKAVEKVLAKINEKDEIGKINFNCDVVYSKYTPELSVVDYYLWTIQRYILRNERRYFAALEKNVKLIYDIYGEEKNGNKYGPEKPFKTEKTEPFVKK